MRSFDIKPRQKVQPTPVRQVFPKASKPAILALPKSARRGLKIVAAILVLIIVVLSILAFYILPEARIQVEARTEAVTRDFEIRVGKNQETPNLAEMAVPGKILEEELTDGKTYGATGTKNIGQKASGFVSIYNFSKTTLILKAVTTVLSSNGREYQFTQDVGNIRPTALIGLEDQEVDESSLIPPVPVVALEPGIQYNLLKGARLEIQNEAFGQNPKTLYAIAAEDVSGGTNREISIVTEADISNAHQSLSFELIEKAKKQLSEEHGVNVLDNAMAADVLEPSASVITGTEAKNFKVSQKVRVRAFTFDENEVKNLILERIKRLLPENKVLQEGREARLTTQFANVSLEHGLGILVAHYEGKIIYKVKANELVQKIKGKNVEEIKEILLSRPEIEAAKIKFYPFWVKRAPKIAGKIRLEVMQ